MNNLLAFKIIIWVAIIKTKWKVKTQHAIPENSHFGFAFPFGFLLSQHPGVISNENTYHTVF